eukprot:TRINITY_DN67365_c5_g2_i1.p2 TRINITY_DN67365_c5_g2~~TRINITY_DN67365_c5_g2_i1.p2  ORF type:complete len:119 (+),score=65.39 TRINITY_DN67365_c5_g2_i1:146-502(+)
MMDEGDDDVDSDDDDDRKSQQQELPKAQMVTEDPQLLQQQANAQAKRQSRQSRHAQPLSATDEHNQQLNKQLKRQQKKRQKDNRRDERLAATDSWVAAGGDSKRMNDDDDYDFNTDWN